MRRIYYCSLALCFFVLLSIDGFSQSTWLTLKGGRSIPKLSADGSDTNPLSTGYQSRVGSNFAVSIEQKLSDLFSLELMAEYSQQGGRKDGVQAFPSSDMTSMLDPQVAEQFALLFPGGFPPYFYANFSSVAKMNYLLVPLLAKVTFDLSDRLKLYADAGPFVGILLSAHQITSGTSRLYLDESGTPFPVDLGVNFDKNTDIKDKLHRGNYGLEGNVGLTYSVGKSKFLIEGGGNYGMMNVQKDAANGQNQIGAATVRVGFSYPLGD